MYINRRYCDLDAYQYLYVFLLFIQQECLRRSHIKKWLRKLNYGIKLLCLATCITNAVTSFIPLPYSFIRYSIYDMGEESFLLFFSAWFVFIQFVGVRLSNGIDKNKHIPNWLHFNCSSYPFDWKTPTRYALALLRQCASATAVSNVYIQFPVFASCWLFISIAEDITNEMASFNIVIKTSNRNRTALGITKQFCDIGQCYSDAKQYELEKIGIIFAPISGIKFSDRRT